MPRHASPDPPDMRELSRRVAAGDREAFAAVHQRLGAGLQRLFARRLGQRAELAGELAQQTWTRVWDAVVQRRYDCERAAISTFVYAVAGNVWLQFCRTLRTRTDFELRDELAAPGGPAGLLQHAELLDALRGCLRAAEGRLALSDQEREVVLAAARGETERQLAARLGLAASTVNARKQSAYGKLRSCLEAQGFTPEIIEQMELRYE